jgi:hypothetical protein
MFNFKMSSKVLLFQYHYILFRNHVYNATFIFKNKILLCPLLLKCRFLFLTAASSFHFSQSFIFFDRLCGLVATVPGYRSRGSGFDPRRYQIFCEVVGLERGPFSLVNTTEELLGRNSRGFGLENREYGRGGPLR